MRKAHLNRPEASSATDNGGGLVDDDSSFIRVNRGTITI